MPTPRLVNGFYKRWAAVKYTKNDRPPSLFNRAKTSIFFFRGISRALAMVITTKNRSNPTCCWVTVTVQKTDNPRWSTTHEKANTPRYKFFFLGKGAWPHEIQVYNVRFKLDMKYYSVLRLEGRNNAHWRAMLANTASTAEAMMNMMNMPNTE